MKKPSRASRPTSDHDHLIRLHQEASVQLSLLSSTLHLANDSTGESRDLFDRIATAHLNTYLDLIHTIGLHDTALGTHFSVPPPNTSYQSYSRILRSRLADTLILYHREQIARLQQTDISRIYSDTVLTEEKYHLAEMIRLLTI